MEGKLRCRGECERAHHAAETAEQKNWWCEQAQLERMQDEAQRAACVAPQQTPDSKSDQATAD